MPGSTLTTKFMEYFSGKAKKLRQRIRNGRKSNGDENTLVGEPTVFSGDPSLDARRGNLLPPFAHRRGKPSHFTDRSPETVVDGGTDLRNRLRNDKSATDLNLSLKGTGGDLNPADLSPTNRRSLSIGNINGHRGHIDQCKNKLLVESCEAYDKGWYIPVTVLESVLSEKSINSILRECVESDTQDIPGLLSTICGNSTANPQEKVEYRKVLATLILSSKCHHISDFISAGLSDDKLPFWKLGEKRRPYQLGLDARSEPLGCFDEWADDEVEGFDNHQWEVLAPFFTRGPQSDDRVQRYQLHHRIPLPFTPWDKDNFRAAPWTSSTPFARAGGNGRVVRVKIHSAHHQLPVFTVSNPTYCPYWLLTSSYRAKGKRASR